MYQEPLDAVLISLKFKGGHHLGADLGAELGRLLSTEAPRFDVVVPVPLHRWRRLRRGFNQAEAIAGPAARGLGLRLANVLSREKATRPQTRQTRLERRQSLSDAFRVRRNHDIVGRSVLLVDDVITTGATLDGAAGALKRAGADFVHCAAIARTPTS